LVLLDSNLEVDGYKLIDFGCARLELWSRWICLAEDGDRILWGFNHFFRVNCPNKNKVIYTEKDPPGKYSNTRFTKAPLKAFPDQV